MGTAGGEARQPADGWLVGRSAEQALIAERLDDSQSGAAILLRGPAGIGKSALAENAVRRAGSSRRILRTVGTSPETKMAMAGLYQLLQPLLPLALQIPEPRQAALRVAFGVAAGPPPEPFAVAMAALDLLVEAAAEQPLLVIAEDLHLLDTATVDVLRFLARRLQHDPVVLLATARDEEPDPLGGAATCLLDLGPLGPEDSRQLLESVVSCSKIGFGCWPAVSSRPQAARLYSLIRPLSTGLRRIRWASSFTSMVLGTPRSQPGTRWAMPWCGRAVL